MKKSRFTEEQMESMLREADRTTVSAPFMTLGHKV